MRIDPEVLAVLKAAGTDGCAFTLHSQLDPALYARVNLVLSAVGGKWNRGQRAHIFPGDAADAIAGILVTGEVTTDAERGYFPTPASIVERLLDMAEIAADMLVLEPSAGRGAIAERAADRGAVVDCIELDETRAEHLRSGGFARCVTTGDFLQQPVVRAYDRALLNPPFASQQDIQHVVRAARFVQPGGLVVAIMSAGLTFRTDEVSADFRARVREARGTIDPLPDDAFAAAGTKMRAVLVGLPVRDQRPPLSRAKGWNKARPEDFNSRPQAAQTRILDPRDTDPYGTPTFDSLQ